MSVNLSIKDVPEAVAERLRQRAALHHRSLQGELMHIIQQAAQEPPATPVHDGSRAPGLAHSWTQGSKSIEQLMAERQASGWRPDPSLAAAPLGVDIVRADRDAR